LELSYKGNPQQKGEDIKRWYKDRFRKSFPKYIYIDDRTTQTIALSLIAYEQNLNYFTLKKLYERLKKQTKPN